MKLINEFNGQKETENTSIHIVRYWLEHKKTRLYNILVTCIYAKLIKFANSLEVWRVSDVTEPLYFHFKNAECDELFSTNFLANLAFYI